MKTTLQWGGALRGHSKRVLLGSGAGRTYSVTDTSWLTDGTIELRVWFDDAGAPEFLGQHATVADAQRAAQGHYDAR